MQDPAVGLEPASDYLEDTERTRLPTLWRVLRHHLGRLLAAISPALACALLYMLFFGADFLFGADLAVFGVRDEATQQRVFARYGGLIRDEQLRILLVYAGLGLVVGAGASLLSWGWARTSASLRAGAPRALGRRVLLTLGVALAFHVWQMAHAIARVPQVFTEAFYDKGGARRVLMLALTHYVPAPLVDGLFIGGLLGLVLGPLWTPAGKRWLDTAVRQRLKSTSTPLGRRLTVAVALTLVGLVLIYRSIDRRPGAAPPGVPPSILLIAVDSLRADRVGPWARGVAPNLAALADRSVRFDAAQVTVPRTFPSFVTLLTGRYPHHHGIRTMFPAAAERAGVGPALPGILARAGYQTHVISDFCGEIFSRIDLGFRDVQVPAYDVKTIVRQRSVTIHPNLLPYVAGVAGRQVFPALESLAELSDPDLLASRAIAVLERYRDQPQPFFMTVFFSSAHFPYAAPAPYYRRFTNRPYRGPFRYHKPPLLEGQSASDQREVRALYDGAVAATDAAIGRLLEGLRQRGLDRRTIVVLLSDHGENLYDDQGRGMGHGDHLEGNHSLQIPLLIHDPVHRFPVHAVPGIVRDIDLTPTLLQLVEGSDKVPPSQPSGQAMDGSSLVPLLRAEHSTLGLSSFSETELWFTPFGPGFDPDNRLPYPGVTSTTDIDPRDDIFLSERWRDLVTVAKHRALRTERWKLIYRPTRSGVHWTLYDLRADPNETRDVKDLHPQEFSMLQAELLRFLADDPKAVVEGGYVIPQ